MIARRGGGGSNAKAIAHHFTQADQCPPSMCTLEKLPHAFYWWEWHWTCNIHLVSLDQLSQNHGINHRITEYAVLEGCPLTPLACSLWEGRMKSRGNLGAVQHCPGITKSLVCYQDICHNKSKGPCQLLWWKLLPAQPDPVYTLQ